jgi:hypothetical protein
MVNSTSPTSDKKHKKVAKSFISAEQNKNEIKTTAVNMANEDLALNSIASSGTGDALMSDVAGRTKEYRHLIDYGLDAKVANRLDEIFKTGKNWNKVCVNYKRSSCLKGNTTLYSLCRYLFFQKNYSTQI